MKEEIWLCGKCERTVKRDQQFVYPLHDGGEIVVPYAKFLTKPPPEDPVEGWVACDYCENDETAWYHYRCVNYDQQVRGALFICLFVSFFRELALRIAVRL